MAPLVRVILQQCTSAKVRVSFPQDPEEFAAIEKSIFSSFFLFFFSSLGSQLIFQLLNECRGIIVYVTFLKDATKEVLPELGQSLFELLVPFCSLTHCLGSSVAAPLCEAVLQ